MTPLIDIYADAFRVETSELTISLGFGEQGHGALLPVVVKMNPVAAKELAMVLRAQIKKLEEHIGTMLSIPHDHYEKMKVAPEDW